MQDFLGRLCSPARPAAVWAACCVGLSAALLLAGCDVPHTPAPPAAPAAPAAPVEAPALPDGNALPTDAAMPDAPPVPPAPFTRLYFQCDNGERLEWWYFPVQGVVSIRLGGQNHELHPVPPTRQREQFAGYGVQAQLSENVLHVKFPVLPRTLQCQRVQP